MYDDLGTTLRKLAKTAAVAALLGMLIYGAVTAVAEQSHGRWLIVLVLSAPMVALLERFPFAMAHGNRSSLLFSRASSPDQVIPPDRDLL